MQVSHPPHSIPGKVLHPRETLHHCRGGHSGMGKRLEEIRPKLHHEYPRCLWTFLLDEVCRPFGASFWQPRLQAAPRLSGQPVLRACRASHHSLLSEPCSPQRLHQLPLPGQGVSLAAQGLDFPKSWFFLRRGGSLHLQSQLQLFHAPGQLPSRLLSLGLCA